MTATIVELPMSITVPDTVEELLTLIDSQPAASLLLYAGSGGPKLSMEFGWTPSDPSIERNWRGKE